jgi:hypothetical protein
MPKKEVKARYFLIGGAGEIEETEETIEKKADVLMPKISDDEIERLYNHMIKFDANYKSFQGTKRDYVYKKYITIRQFFGVVNSFGIPAFPKNIGERLEGDGFKEDKKSIESKIKQIKNNLDDISFRTDKIRIINTSLRLQKKLDELENQLEELKTKYSNWEEDEEEEIDQEADELLNEAKDFFDELKKEEKELKEKKQIDEEHKRPQQKEEKLRKEGREKQSQIAKMEMRLQTLGKKLKDKKLSRAQIEEVQMEIDELQSKYDRIEDEIADIEDELGETIEGEDIQFEEPPETLLYDQIQLMMKETEEYVNKHKEFFRTHYGHTEDDIKAFNSKLKNNLDELFKNRLESHDDDDLQFEYIQAGINALSLFYKSTVENPRPTQLENITLLPSLFDFEIFNSYSTIERIEYIDHTLTGSRYIDKNGESEIYKDKKMMETLGYRDFQNSLGIVNLMSKRPEDLRDIDITDILYLTQRTDYEERKGDVEERETKTLEEPDEELFVGEIKTKQVKVGAETGMSSICDTAGLRKKLPGALALYDFRGEQHPTFKFKCPKHFYVFTNLYSYDIATNVSGVKSKDALCVTVVYDLFDVIQKQREKKLNWYKDTDADFWKNMTATKKEDGSIKLKMPTNIDIIPKFKFSDLATAGIDIKLFTRSSKEDKQFSQETKNRLMELIKSPDKSSAHQQEKLKEINKILIGQLNNVYPEILTKKDDGSIYIDERFKLIPQLKKYISLKKEENKITKLSLKKEDGKKPKPKTRAIKQKQTGDFSNPTVNGLELTGYINTYNKHKDEYKNEFKKFVKTVNEADDQELLKLYDENFKYGYPSWMLKIARGAATPGKTAPLTKQLKDETPAEASKKIRQRLINFFNEGDTLEKSQSDLAEIMLKNPSERKPENQQDNKNDFAFTKKQVAPQPAPQQVAPQPAPQQVAPQPAPQQVAPQPAPKGRKKRVNRIQGGKQSKPTRARLIKEFNELDYWLHQPSTTAKEKKEIKGLMKVLHQVFIHHGYKPPQLI